MEGNTFELTFSSHDSAKCTAVQTESTKFVCLTNKLNTNQDSGKTYSMTIVINGLTVANSLSFKTKSDVQASTNLNPNSASPVLKTVIEISLSPDFPYEMLDPKDFSVNATSVNDANYIRYLNVLTVDDSTKTMRAMFGGAYTGIFQMNIRHKFYGLVDTENMLLDVSSKVTGVTPLEGSIHGGTLLTITGTNFGT